MTSENWNSIYAAPVGGSNVDINVSKIMGTKQLQLIILNIFYNFP